MFVRIVDSIMKHCEKEQREMMSNKIDARFLPEPFKSRIITYQDTLELCKLIPTSQLLTYKYAFQADWHPSPRNNTTIVSVIHSDTFVAAQRLPGKVAVLSFADDSFPTGCASTGSGAQEESLCYRSTLSRHIDIRYYPLMSNVLLYSPGVVVFKAPEEEHFAAIPDPFSVDVISCPGVRHPCLDPGTGHMTASDIQILRTKIANILQVAYIEKVDHLVLGALGCGAWKNPPEDVASTFKQILDSYPGLFVSIVFAIKPSPVSFNRWSDKDCFDTFHRHLNSHSV